MAEMTDNFPLVLVDGSSFLYRAYHASKQGFSNSKGIPTGVSLIITRMLKSLTKKFSSSKFIMVFDAKGKSFRNDIYPEYKANRPPMPDDLRVQVEYVHAIVKAMGFPVVSIEGVEADDVLGTYAKEATEKGIKTLICTGDKDLSQLVNDNVILYDSMKEIYYDREGVIEKFGVPPELIIDFLALKGDSSDNIPGMAGCGDKTAIALLNGLGGIESIFEKKDAIASLDFRGAKNFAPKYEAAIDTIRLSYTLATIKTDVELPLSVDDAQIPKANREELLALYKELEFNSFIKELSSEDLNEAQKSVSSSSVTEGVQTTLSIFDEAPAVITDYKSFGSDFILVNTQEKLIELANAIKEKKLVALDTETTSVHPVDCSLVGMSFSVKEKEGYYIPVNHSYLGVPEQLSLDRIKEVLDPVLNSDEVMIVGHNIKFDLEVLHYQNFEIKKVYADTMLLSHLLDSSALVNMDDLALNELNYKTITYKEVTGDKKKLPISEVDVESVCNYAAEDAEVTLRLYNTLISKCSDKDKELFFNLEMPMLYVLYTMEINGVLLDCEELDKQNHALKLELSDIEHQIYVSAGQEFNVASPKQLSKVLFEDLKIPYPKKAKDGKYSTNEEILEAIAPNYDIANLVLRYRELAKLISTYTEKLPSLISPKTGRIHTSFNQAGTVTGRLSSSDPNLQNIPARTNEGKLIRKAFVAPQGYKIIAADYSQIELRLIAHLSEDPVLKDAFIKGLDVHRATAAEVLGKPIEAVSAQERSQAKATNFGLMYGMGAFGLTRQTGMSNSEAKIYIERYFARYPKIKSFMEQVKSYAHQYGYVNTIDGRRITIANINSTNTMMLKAAERACINAPMQGSAADIIKKAMIDLHKWIKGLPENKVRMTVQVHDELLFEVAEDFVDEAKATIEKIMSSACTLSIPLTVGVGVSDSWADAH